MSIKDVPSRVFNQGLKKWLQRTIEPDGNTTGCSYCSHYLSGESIVNAMTRCACPLSKANQCCGGLYFEYMGLARRCQKKEAKAVAEKIVDFIIDHCVYESRTY